MKKITATDEAKTLLNNLKTQHGNLIFVHSEGCCEGTSPMCMPEDDFYIGSQYERIGEIDGVPYYMHHSNSPYWQYLQIIIDVDDLFGNTYSLESAENKSFVIQSKRLK